MRIPSIRPSEIFVTSLFTYSWKPVHSAVRFYKTLYPDVPLTLGGIYATLLPDHAKGSGCDEVHTGLMKEAEDLMPDYSLVPEWNGSLIFSSRGCIRKCPFCAVPQMEGGFHCRDSIKNLIYPGHSRIILWDNNFLASKHWYEILSEIRETGLSVDFNQGLDARLLNEEKAEVISALKCTTIRMAYDDSSNDGVGDAIDLLSRFGLRRRSVLVYALYNFRDDPEDLLERIRAILDWGAVCYPMRYQPIDSLEKDSYVSDSWTEDKLEMVADARRVLGSHGAFPPYDALINKLRRARTFEGAFRLRPPRPKTRART